MVSRRNQPSRLQPWFASRPGRWLLSITVGALVLAGTTAWAVQRIKRVHFERQLLSTPMETVMQHPSLVRGATARAKALYAKNCVECHGANMKGNTAIGAPDLIDSTWLYGTGKVFDIDRTILFGIRDARARTRDVTEMPAFGQRGVLKPSEIQDVVEYLRYLSGAPHLSGSVDPGRKAFNNLQRGNCGDCHGYDAKGDDYLGAPDLTVGVWNWGGSKTDLYDSIYYGRHGVMPGWLGKLDLAQIRELAIYICSLSQRPAASGSSTAGLTKDKHDGES